jgi:hypothetical protein
MTSIEKRAAGIRFITGATINALDLRLVSSRQPGVKGKQERKRGIKPFRRPWMTS